MTIREYKVEDKESWIRCRVLSFLDCSYYDDVQNFRDEYENPSIRMVALEGNQVVGFLDCEYEEIPGSVCYFQGEKGGVIWHLGVLPEYRNQKVAANLWQETKRQLIEKGVKRVEVWTQDDEASNHWYRAQGFKFREAYLNAYMKGTSESEALKNFVNFDKGGEILGVRSFNFEAPIERKAELSKICYRLHEVRVYETYLI